jgi:hypothetical protein
VCPLNSHLCIAALCSSQQFYHYLLQPQSYNYSEKEMHTRYFVAVFYLHICKGGQYLWETRSKLWQPTYGYLVKIDRRQEIRAILVMKCTPMPPWQSAQSLPIYMLPPPS